MLSLIYWNEMRMICEYFTCLQIDTLQQIVVGALPIGGYFHKSLQIVGCVLFVHL